MRRLNFKFLGIVFAMVIAIAGGMFLVHRFQKGRIARGLLYQAEKAHADGRHDKASTYYVQYLALQPEDDVVRIALAELLEQQMENQPLYVRNPTQVIFLYDQVLLRDPGRHDVRRKQIKLSLWPRLRRFQDALTHLDVLQRDLPADGELWQLRGSCLEGQSKYEEAAAAYRKAIDFPPDQVRSHELLARLLRQRLNRIKDADEIIERMVRQHAETHEAYLARARYRLEFKLGEVDSDAAEALKRAPDNCEALLLSARVEQSHRRYERAIALLENAIQLYPNDPRAYRHAAWIEYHLKRHDSARERLQVGIVQCPEAYELHTSLAELLIQAKAFDQVQKILTELKTKGVREDRLNYLSARIHVAHENWPEAAAILNRLRSEVRYSSELSVQVNLLLAHCHRQLGDSDRQLDALKRVLEFDAHSSIARQGIAALHAACGRLDESIREYQLLLAQPNAPDHTGADLVRIMIARTQRLPARDQNWSEIARLVEQIEKREPASIEWTLARSDLAAAMRPDGEGAREAAQLLATATAKSKEPRLWLQSAHYAELANRSGLAVLDEAEAKVGDLVEFRLKRAAILLHRSPGEFRRSLSTLESPPTDFSDDQKMQLAQGLGDVCLAAHDYANARRILSSLAAARPHDLQVRLSLVEVALREHDQEALQKWLEEIRRIEPAGGVAFPLADARFQIFLAENGDRNAIPKARAILQKLLEQRPNWAVAYQCLGRTADTEGDRAQAIEHYRQAIKLGDIDLRTHVRLVQLLTETKQTQEAETLLAQVKQQGTMSPERQRQLLQNLSPLLPGSSMQSFARGMLAKDSSDPHDHIWLGKMLWDTGDRAGATEEFRKAIALGGKSPETWITLVQALAMNGQTDEARSQLEEAKRQLPPEKIPSTLAACYETLRMFDEALAHFAQALALQPLDGQVVRRYVRLMLSLGKTRQAVDVLQQVADKPLGLSKEDVAWARRNLAILGTAGRKPEEFERAFALLKQNEKDCGVLLEDLRAKVILLAHLPPQIAGGTSPRRQAIAVLEKIVPQPNSTREDRFSLAKLYDAEKEWDKAERQYRIVIESDPNNPAPLTHYVRRQLQLGMVHRVGAPLQSLEKIAPDAPATINLKARYHYHSGEIERALAVLTEHVQRAAVNSSDAGNRAYAAAVLLDELARNTQPLPGQPDSRSRLKVSAMHMYQRAVSRRPEALVRAAALLSHFGELDLAMQMLEQPGVPLNLKASATIAALRAAHAPADACAKLEAWLKQAAERNPQLRIELHLADLAEMRHDLPTAIRLYRQVLSEDANHVVALNNLAWVLAHEGKDLEAALELVQRAVALVGPIVDLLDTRARVYLAMGRAPEALQDLEDAIADSPTAMRYFHLAQALAQCGHAQAAKDAFTQAVRHGIDARDLHSVDAEAFEKMKKG